jgi:hypothetical protein
MHREITTRTAVTILLFLAGAVLGSLMLPHVIDWFVASSSASLITASVNGIAWARVEFGLGCGILFGLAGFFGKSLPRGTSLLAVGLAASTAVGAHYGASLATSATYAPSTVQFSLHVDQLPTLRIPLIGAVVICCVAGLLHYFGGGKSTRMRA